MPKHSFCSYCGIEYGNKEVYPRNCGSCGEFEYCNPIPVVNIIQPVLVRTATTQSYGLLVIKRGREPGKDMWALPGGFVDNKETWQVAARREFFEECQFSNDAQTLGIFDIRPNTKKTEMIVFAMAEAIEESAVTMSKFVPNEECLDRKIIFVPEVLAFPTHTEAVIEFFKRLKSYNKVQ